MYIYRYIYLFTISSYDFMISHNILHGFLKKTLDTSELRHWDPSQNLVHAAPRGKSWSPKIFGRKASKHVSHCQKNLVV